MIKCFWLEPTGERRIRETAGGTCEEGLYTTGEGKPITLREAPPGAMWHAPWNPAEWHGEDGIALMVKTPGGDWFVDGRAKNCTAPDDWTEERNGSTFCRRPKHRCWVRHGDPRTGLVTVDKNGPTCGAGAGSIATGSYHGFLQRGYLT